MSLWLSLLLIICSALLAWLIGRNRLLGLVNDLKSQLDSKKQDFDNLNIKLVQFKNSHEALNSNYNTIKIERDQLKENLKGINIKLENEKSVLEDYYKGKLDRLQNDYDLYRENWELKWNEFEQENRSKILSLESQLKSSQNKAPKEIEIIKEVVKEIEVIKEIPVEIIKEVEVVKSVDLKMLQQMIEQLETIEVSRTVTDIIKNKKIEEDVENNKNKNNK